MFSADRSSQLILQPSRRSLGWVCTATMLVFSFGGCSKESIDSAVSAVKETGQDLASRTQDMANNAVTAAKEQLPETGSASLNLDPRFVSDSAQVRIVNIADGRESVLQISNYAPDTVPSSYPQLFIQGNTRASSISQLSGKAVMCSIYAKSDASSPLIATPDGELIRVMFSSPNIEKGTIKATINRGNLITPAGQTIRLNGGSVTALVPVRKTESDE